MAFFALAMYISCCLSRFFLRWVPKANAVLSGIWALELSLLSVMFWSYIIALSTSLRLSDTQSQQCPICRRHLSVWEGGGGYFGTEWTHTPKSQ